MTDTERERQPNTTTHDSIPAKTGKNDGDGTSGDCISRQAAIDKFINELEEIFSDIREREVDDSVCGLCEYDGAYIGQSGEWCNECPGFDRDDCFKLSDKIRKEWTDEIIKALPSAQPETNCSEIPNNWIPCSERLPENDDDVIVQMNDGSMMVDCRAASSNGWFWAELGDEPVAWMPLPEPARLESD